MTDNKIIFTAEKREELRVAYDATVKRGDDTFWFDGVEIVTGYAKYLIEYLDMKFGPSQEQEFAAEEAMESEHFNK